MSNLITTSNQLVKSKHRLSHTVLGEPIRVFAFLVVFFMTATVFGTELKGYLNTGVWYLKNNLASDPNFITDDGYGQSYVQGDFALFNANANFDFLHLNNPSASTQVSAHLKGRFLYNLMDNPYSLSPSERYRYQTDEANVQTESNMMDLWIGRHTVYETDGIGVDGLTGLFHIKNEQFGIGVFAGLGNDPRTLTGYIGPSYKTDPFTADFYTGGTFAKLHYDKFQMDMGVSTLLFKKSVDRSNFFTQFHWIASNAWSFSGFADAGFMGDKGLQKGLFMITTKMTPKLTNRFSFSEFRSLFYDASNISAIPVPASINPTFDIGTDVNTTEYYVLRDEIQYRFDRNYIFTGVEFGRRTFDDLNRVKYTLGYFDPVFLKSEFDFRIQADIIDNYRSFNSSIDVMIGRDFSNEKFRAEIGGTFYANERDLYLDNAFVSSSNEIEKETTGRVNFQWNTAHNLSWFLNYAFYKETDVVNVDQQVLTHEVYLSSNLRF